MMMKIQRYTDELTGDVTLRVRASAFYQMDSGAAHDERVLQHVKHRLLLQLQTQVADLDLDDLEIEDV